MKRIAFAITLTGLFYCIVIDQGHPQTQGKSESTIELSYYKKADMTKTAVAIVKVRRDSKFVPAKNAKVVFYVMHENVQRLLKSVNTNNKGKAVIVLQKDLPLEEDHSFSIVAKIENDSMYENAEEYIHYKDANLTLHLNPHDTDRIVTARVTEVGNDGKEIPVKGVELKFYVQRMFGIMPAIEANTISTDEKGEATLVYPKNIPGDSAGGLTVVAKIEDNEQFGNLENKAVTSWGTVLEAEKDPYPRSLWEPSAPLPLILSITLMFGGVWCSYFFIFFHLRKIKKGENILL